MHAYFGHDNTTAISANAFASGGDQNCGNVMTGRNTSRVLQAPGGTQSFTLGEEEEEAYLGGSSRLAAQPSFPTVSGRHNEDEEESIDPSALKSMTLPDLRILCRNNHIQPAGCKETLVERLEEMIARGVSVLAVKTKTTTSSRGPPSSSTKNNTNTGNSTTTLNRVPLSNENNNNNYVRSNSQNVGNFLTGRNSSRVLAPPGGASSGIF
ncbi:unnamed protein product [Bathycoccus prasinos]